VIYAYFDMLSRLIVEAGRWNDVANIPLVVSSRDFRAVKLQWEAKSAEAQGDAQNAKAKAAQLTTLSQEPS
jgi:hypothetical protein